MTKAELQKKYTELLETNKQLQYSYELQLGARNAADKMVVGRDDQIRDLTTSLVDAKEKDRVSEIELFNLKRDLKEYKSRCERIEHGYGILRVEYDDALGVVKTLIQHRQTSETQRKWNG